MSQNNIKKDGSFFDEILKPALVLFTICAISAVCLAFVYNVTKEPIAQQIQTAEDEAKKTVLPEAISFEADIEIDDTINSAFTGYNDAGEVVGYVIGVSEFGYSSDIQIMVGIDTTGTIVDIAITYQAETPGLGANAVLPEFTDQFIGKTYPLTVTKNPAAQENEIVAITSSTITTDAIVTAVNTALEFYNNNLGGNNDK